MLELQWDRNAALQARYEDGRDEGIGIGVNLLAKLIDTLIKNGKSDIIPIIVSDESKRNEYFKKYGII